MNGAAGLEPRKIEANWAFLLDDLYRLTPSNRLQERRKVQEALDAAMAEAGRRS